ncbi:McrB family protein [Streptomyces sp. NPDC020965]|uniref:McrB family protein n=1 Tax=Streptomyces sp. NPDC020965 TaxID=3365105 RepID=UPI0037A0A821
MTPIYADTPADPAQYLPPAPQQHPVITPETAQSPTPPPADPPVQQPPVQPPADLGGQIEHVAAYVAARGFVFEPWQIAAFITAVRTKPFVILAGISGTGKTKLPRLVAEATGAECVTVPVRPDWTDSSELLGYERLDGSFQPGELLRVAREAWQNPDRQFFFVLDEMNIARVEYYLAEVLSQLESRAPDADGRVVSGPLAPHLAGSAHDEWATVGLPANLCLVGSVNMDETTFGFSKKVLDRAFVIEFSTVDLFQVKPVDTGSVAPVAWGSAEWRVPALALGGHPAAGTQQVTSIIEILAPVNEILTQGQLQFGYRVRDEITMFCLTAKDCAELFTTPGSGTVDPLDLAIAMKVLPRVQGGGATVRGVLEGLQRWAAGGSGTVGGPQGAAAEDGQPGSTGEAGPSVSTEEDGQPGSAAAPGAGGGQQDAGQGAQYPFCADRLALMLRRLQETGFTTFWL